MPFSNALKISNERNNYPDTWYSGQRNYQSFFDLMANTIPKLFKKLVCS